MDEKAGVVVRQVDFVTAVRFCRSRTIRSPCGLLTDHEPVVGDGVRSVQVLSLAVSNQPLFAHLRNKDVVRDIWLGSVRYSHRSFFDEFSSPERVDGMTGEMSGFVGLHLQPQGAGAEAVS